MKPIRVLVSKPGLDGHDRGAKVVARALRDAGFEVIYTGLRQSPEHIAEIALQEDVDVIGLSVLSGAHATIVKRLFQELHDRDIAGKTVIVGGVIPETDIPELKAMGVAEVFTPGAPTSKVIDFVNASVAPTLLGYRECSVMY